MNKPSVSYNCSMNHLGIEYKYYKDPMNVNITFQANKNEQCISIIGQNLQHKFVHLNLIKMIGVVR